MLSFPEILLTCARTYNSLHSIAARQKAPIFRAMQGKNEHRTNEQSAKKRRMSVAVRKELLSLRHKHNDE